MHHIIVTTLQQSERDRLNIGASRPEESRPLQSLFSKVMESFSNKKAPQHRKPSHGTHADCACHPAR